MWEDIERPLPERPAAVFTMELSSNLGSNLAKFELKYEPYMVNLNN